MASSSILETFFLLFDSNADKVKKGNQDAQKSSTDLEHSLNAADTAGVEMGEHLVQSLKDVAVAFVAAFSVEQVAATIKETADLNAQLGITAERLGLAVEDLDAWQRATEHAGGSSEGFTQTLDYLNRGIADIATKGTSRLKPFFDELKIKVTDAPHHVRPLLSILGDLSDKLSGLSAQQRAGIAEKLGIDEGTVLLLAQGRRGVEDLVQRQKDLGVVTEKDTEQAHKFKQSMEDLETRFHLLSTAAGNEVFPILEKFFDVIGKIITYLGQHKGLVEGFFIGIAGVITAIYLPAAVEAAAATWAFLAPILAVVIPIAAVGAAVALLVDDIQNFLAGNKSVIGELSKTWPVVGETVRGSIRVIGEAIDWLIDLFKSLFEFGVSAAELFAASIELAIRAVVGAFNWLGNAGTALNAVFAQTFPELAAGFKAVGEVISWFIGLLEKAFGWLAKFASAAVSLLPKAIHNAAGDTHQLALVAEGKQTYAQYEAGQRARLVARLEGRPEGETGPTVNVAGPTARPAYSPGHGFAKEVTEGIAAARAQIHLADTSPLSALNSTVNNQRQGDRNYKFVVENLTVQTDTKDPQQFARAARSHLEDEMRQAISHFDDGVQG